ncbi:hypothetical protein Cfor_06685 [Coptotermes formosanus]|uniref:Protein kinase domain-containing protein n=1 Tax=Coptotermes formosanus TaxID=36987 RepID=A0A6L2QBX8_COPFO|nr:hypothetical protein Cfor_06685 [Coptotermes formosanus]
MKFASVIDDAAIDLLEKMLELDADKRITAEEALAHKYLAQYADPSDEPVSAPYDQSFEDMDLPVEKWKGATISWLSRKVTCRPHGRIKIYCEGSPLLTNVVLKT